MHKVDPNCYYNGGTQEEEMGGAMTDGTTIISCKYNGGILLAADGRSSNVSQILKFISNHQFYRLLEYVCWKWMLG